MPHDDNEIRDLLDMLDAIEHDLNTCIVASPARRLEHVYQHLAEMVCKLRADLETTQNELASKRYQRDSRHNQVITRGMDKAKTKR